MTRNQEILIEENITFGYWKARQWSKKQSIIDSEELDGICLEALTMAALSYDSSRAAFATYATVIIDRAVFAAIKEEKRHMKVRDKITATIESEEQKSEDEFETLETVIDVRKALSKLNPIHRQILIECLIEKHPRQEVADKYGIKKTEVDSIVRACNKIIAKSTNSI